MSEPSSVPRFYQRTCQKCQGAGEVPWNDGTGQRGFFTLVVCRRCGGTGKVTIKLKPSTKPSSV